MPPGKVCDFFGFQYMRDIDAAGKGHNPMFLTRVAGDVLNILNDQQRQMFADLAAEQAPQFEQLALKRMPLIEAFQREKDGSDSQRKFWTEPRSGHPLRGRFLCVSTPS